MGAVKAWGMERVEARTQELYAKGMDWQSAADQAEIEIFGPEYHDEYPSTRNPLQQQEPSR